jgi:hypothetical protein
MRPADIISRWPSAEVFADDLGLKWRSHGRVMRLRNSIPETYWQAVAEAAKRRGYADITSEVIAKAHAKEGVAA